MNKATKKASENTVFHNSLTVLGIIMCVILIPILIINCTLIVRSYVSGDVPNLGGRVPLIVLSNSMYPVIETGDMIICQQTDAETIDVGDVISFFDPAGNGSTIVTHRVVSVTEQDGKLAWATRGDNNNSDDRLLVTEDLLVAEWHGIRIADLGSVAMFMQTAPGLICCVVLPSVLLVAYDMIRRKMYDAQQKDNTEELLRELEDLKRQKAAAEAANTN